MTRELDTSATLRRRDRILVLLLLLLVAGLAWALTVGQALQMEAMDAAMWRDMNMSMNGMEPAWTARDALLLLLMWSSMMAAMMLPGASPMVTAFATINRRRRGRGAPSVSTLVFVIGYLIAWVGFSLLATGLQWLLQRLGLLTTMLQSTSSYWSGALFFAAGLYQFSPLKQRCLAYCRSQESFILNEWRDGELGAVVMGVRHGLFCIGCCGGLMFLLFAVAVMDLRWVAALTALVTAEKLLPAPNLWRIAIGTGLIAAGLTCALLTGKPHL